MITVWLYVNIFLRCFPYFLLPPLLSTFRLWHICPSLIHVMLLKGSIQIVINCWILFIIEVKSSRIKFKSFTPVNSLAELHIRNLQACRDQQTIYEGRTLLFSYLYFLCFFFLCPLKSYMIWWSEAERKQILMQTVPRMSLKETLKRNSSWFWRDWRV